MSVLHKLEAFLTVANICFESNAPLGKSINRFLCSGGIVGVIYSDDEVVMRRQSLGDDEAQSSAS